MKCGNKIIQDMICRILRGDETVLDELGYTKNEKKEIIDYAEKRRKKIVRMAKRLGKSAGEIAKKTLEDIIGG